jgi:hypothetical protein
MFGSESLPFDKGAEGYRCLSVPLFVKDLSVGDVISASQDAEGFVDSWAHVLKSGNSTVWLLRLAGEPPIAACLEQLRSLQCNTSGLESFGCYAVDVPAALPLADVDAVLEMLDQDLVAVAFPSLRHDD